GEQQEDHRQDRNQHAVQPLDAAAYAAGDDEHGDGHGGRLPDRRLHRHGDEAHGVEAVPAIRGLPESPADGTLEILQRPAGDHRVIAEQQHRGGDAEPADDTPEALAAGDLIGRHGVALRVPADRQFGDHEGQADEGDAENVDDQEGAAAVVARHIGEAPDV